MGYACSQKTAVTGYFARRYPILNGQSATKKAYCDKELSETNTKKAEKTTEIDMMTSRVDQASAKAAKLKTEVSTLQSELLSWPDLRRR